MNITDYGFMPNKKDPCIEGGILARVTAVHKERYALVCEYGEIYARLKSREYYLLGADFPTTGDFVLIEYIDNGDSRILATLPRRTFFSRRAPSTRGGEQAVAANFDYVFIMQSLNHDFNARRLERYLTLTWQSGATPVIILTKSDLCADVSEHIAVIESMAPMVDICALSSKTGEGMDVLSPYLQPMKTIVFLGSSGVGKSTLVNALAGKEIMSVNEIREDDSKGRHTTTYRQLVMLDSGVMIIDTPGMRELGMWDVSNGLGDTFADVEKYIGQCRFTNCHHNSEPGCAIRAAIESGELSSKRFESYKKLAAEAECSAEDIRKKRQQRDKAIAKYSRKIVTKR